MRRRLREKSTATTGWPSAASVRAWRPLPHPTSTMRAVVGSIVANVRTSCQGSEREAAKGSAMRSYVARTRALVTAAIERTGARRTIKGSSGLERGPVDLGDHAASDFLERGQRFLGLAAVQVLDVHGLHPCTAGRTLANTDLVRAILGAAEGFLPRTELPALGHRPALDLDDVAREVDRRGVAQRGADAEAVRSGGQEGGDRLLVDIPGDVDLHVLVAADVELP